MITYILCHFFKCFLLPTVRLRMSPATDFMYFDNLSDAKNAYNADFASKITMWTLTWYFLHVFPQQNEKHIVIIKV